MNDDGTAGRSTMGDTSPIRKAELEFVLSRLGAREVCASWSYLAIHLSLYLSIVFGVLALRAHKVCKVFALPWLMIG